MASSSAFFSILFIKIGERIRDGAVIGYKYFDFYGVGLLALEVRGQLAGTVTVSHDAEGAEIIGAIELEMTAADWSMVLLPVAPEQKTRALYLRYEGEGEWELKSFCFFAQ